MKRLTFLVAIFMLACVMPAWADNNFVVPTVCKYGVTGADGAEDDDPPVVTITYTKSSRNQRVTSTVTLGYNSITKIWSASVVFPYPFQTYLVTTTYTPFLQSYFALTSGETRPFQLPAPGWNGETILSRVLITIKDGNQRTLPYAYLEMAPNFGGSSPYTTQADGNGQVVINCYTDYAIIEGNPATVFDSNHNLLYSGAVIVDHIDPSDESATATAAPGT